MPISALLQRLPGRQAASHRIPEGRRVYAIGDIHGRLDLLVELLALIDADDRERGASHTTLIFLGDLVDRGPHSRGVVQRLLDISRTSRDTRFLLGNHEDVFLRAVKGDPRATRFLIRIGGRQTLLSYGITEAEYDSLGYEALTALLTERVPAAHVDFLSGFELTAQVGDYLFVHAGLRPGIALDEQDRSELCWIRDEFLSHRGSFGPLVVHGHSITDEVDVQPNRIGIDTGAFATGRLTAIGLENTDRWFIGTGDPCADQNGKIPGR